MASPYPTPDVSSSSPSFVPPKKVVQNVTYAVPSTQPSSSGFVVSTPHISQMEMAPAYDPKPYAPPSSKDFVPDDDDDETVEMAIIPDQVSSASNANMKTFTDVEVNTASVEIKQKMVSNEASIALSNTVERIVNSAESREAAARESSRAYGEKGSNGNHGNILDSVHGGQLSSMELSQLSLMCTDSVVAACSPNSVGEFRHENYSNNGWKSPQSGEKRIVGGEWASLDGDLLASLVPMLQAHVASAVGIDLVGEGRDLISNYMENVAAGNYAVDMRQWMMKTSKHASHGDPKMEPGAGYHRLQVLQSGLEAANILLALMASPGIDRRAVDDDAIESCVNLIKTHIQKHLIPALSNTGHLGVTSCASNPEGDDEDDEEDMELPPEMMIPKLPKKSPKKATPNRNELVKGLRLVYGHLLSTVGLFGTILERAENFIVTTEMDDRLLFTLSAAILSTLSIDASPTVRADAASLASIVQVSAMNLVVAIFRRYPRHRSIIVEDLFPLMLKLPTSKRSLRTYLVKKGTVVEMGEGGKTPLRSTPNANHIADSSDHQYIQPICALTLLMIQSCVVMPYQSDEDAVEEGDADADADSDEEDDDSHEKLNSKANDTSGLDGSVAICNQLTSQMLLRCSRKGEEGGASEFRPILHNLIDDLLVVRYLPEYPAAEMLLLYLSHKLGHDLLRSSSLTKNNGVQAETTYLATAMDAFGKITSAVASSLLQNRENPFKLPESMSPGHFEPKEEVNRCFCGRDNIDTFMIDCDRCHSWYHGSCIGVTKDTVPEIWLCDDCTLQTAVLAQSRVFIHRGGDHSGALTQRDHNHILRQLLLHYLTSNAQASPTPQAERAREFLIATWVKDLTLSKKNAEDVGIFDVGLVRSHVIAQWFPRIQQPQNSNLFLSEEGNRKTMLSLVASSELALSFPRLLGVLLRLMGDEMTSLRKLSLKAILQVVNVDPALMAQPSLKKEVSRCFHDEAISVREAAVSLVGDYVLQSPNLAAAFHVPLLERILDRGVSVRKRVVKIFRDILLTNPTYGGSAAACHAMLQRAADRKEDDGVRDLIHETFHTLWFSSKAYKAVVLNTRLSFGSSSGDSVMNSRQSQAGAKAEFYSREAAKQMVEVVKVSGSPDTLTSLVKGLLFGVTEGDKDKKVAERKKRQVDSRNQCSSLVSSLIELLLSFEDVRAQNEEDGKELVALLSTLSVFSQSYPELLVSHIDTLIPYLKGDNGAKRYETSIVSTVSGIVSRIAPHFSSAELNRLSEGELPADLVAISYKFPGDAVSSAVEALCKLANHANPNSIPEKRVTKLAIQFYSYLLKMKDGAIDLMTMKKSVRDNVRRALSALGSICRFYESKDAFDHHNVDPSTFKIVKDISSLTLKGNVLSNACFAIFLEYLKKEDDLTKTLAIRAMTGVFISRPRVVLAAEQLGIIAYVMSEEAPPSVQVESLKCWRDILLAEEKRIESGAAKAKMASQKDITVSKRISGDQDGDSVIAGSCLTCHSKRLYEMTQSHDDKIRYTIVDLIGHLLRQGLLNPMETVPFLLALQGDVKSPSTRSLALKLLINEGEKRPDMLRQRICAGIKESFNFQKKVYPRDENGVPRVTALVENQNEGARIRFETIFDSVIKESSIRNKKAQRQGLYKSIISLFEKEVAQDITNLNKGLPSTTRRATERLPLLEFASQILAHLPYNNLADVLFIYYHASCITALDGAEILTRLAGLLGNDVCDPNSEEDGLERAAKTNNPIQSDECELLRRPDFDVKEFGHLCMEASMLNLLLRLRIFFRTAYNLSEARITEYLPSEKERIHEKGISILEGTSKFDPESEAIIEDVESKKINMNAAIRSYAAFRVLMREGDGEDTTLQFDEASALKKKAGRKRKREEEPPENPEQPSQVSPD